MTYKNISIDNRGYLLATRHTTSMSANSFQTLVNRVILPMHHLASPPAVVSGAWVATQMHGGIAQVRRTPN